jgi:Zn-dependent M28 family amino/carboxypeptidase
MTSPAATAPPRPTAGRLRGRGRGHARATALLAGALLGLAANGCGPARPPSGPPPNAASVVAAITEAGLRGRLEKLAAVTAGSAGFRAVGTAGYDAAADMVTAELRAAGWDVSGDAYTGAAFFDEGGSSLEVGDRLFGSADVRPLIFAPGGTVEGRVVAVDWDPDAADRTGKGCAVTHYGDLPPQAIVVVRSGPCLRRDQVLAAQRAGAAAFVAVYPNAPPGVVYRPTLIDPASLTIPAVAVSRAAADALLAAVADRATARLVTHARTTAVPTRSILAELPGSDPGAVVMLGAHLDSVIDGPGINDDGSGVAALLEIARALRGTRPRATIRLAFWSGEELGLHGSVRYASSLSADDRRAILVYLNADMVASPNGFAGVYDETAAPAGSDAVHALLAAAVERAGGTPVEVDIGGGSDHYGFAQAGVATGGVFSGASEPVTADQAATAGAIAGRPADACYHQSCDDVANANLPLARLLTAALADVTVRLADNPELLRP